MQLAANRSFSLSAPAFISLGHHRHSHRNSRAMDTSSTLCDSNDPPSSPPSVHFTLSTDTTPTTKDKKTKRQTIQSASSRKACTKTFTFLVLAAIVLAVLTSLYQQLTITRITRQLHQHQLPTYDVPQLVQTPSRPQKNNPAEWLRKHTTTDYDQPVEILSKRPKAALISLVRNEELDGILQSMRQLEYYWNRRYRYPWIFFSESGFSKEFKNKTSAATSSPTSYHRIPHAHWSTPPFINITHFHDSLTYHSLLGVGKAHLISYRHMCRWNSGFFFLHPALAEYDYYWRVEPDVYFFCHVGYDVFRFMHENGLKYGFNMNILEDARSFGGLWAATVDFAQRHPQYLHPGADWGWLVDSPGTADGDGTQAHDDGEGGGTGGYNNCQFFSNFEIGSLNFFRSEAYRTYFNHLDQMGGFYYERFGDAPIHTLAVSLFAAKYETWFFRDVGYQHDAARVCPPQEEVGGGGRCSCETTRLDENFYRLVPMESSQKKPRDTCVRRWLGGEWLRKREGWKREVEVALGGDGYGGYLRE